METNSLSLRADTEPLLRRAFWLVVCTMAYNLLEAFVGLWAGIRAESVALVGFSLDSVIEISAGAIVAWRLYVRMGDTVSGKSGAGEVGAKRFVAGTFFALSAYVLWQSVLQLSTGSHPQEPVVGIILAGVSLGVMPVIAGAKIRVARKLRSKALEAEAKETLACAYLSFTLLLGLVCTAVFDWWWADSVAALVMIPWLVHEGKEGFAKEEIES